jgi:hypothetical protein
VTACGTVIAEPDREAPGYWLLYRAAVGTRGTEAVGTEVGKSLAELATAGLTILRPDGTPPTLQDLAGHRRR